MSACTIISDSTCDFSAFQAKASRVEIVPFHYSDTTGSFTGDDDLFQSVSPRDFYRLIMSGRVLHTSQPSQLEFADAFRRVLEGDGEAVVFCISSGLSGGYNGAVLARNLLSEENPDAERRIHIVDSLLASTPMHILVDEACRRRDQGWSAEQIASWALDARYELQTLFMVDGLEALHRGGRVPKTVAVAGDKLNVKPLLTFDLEGKLALCGATRGRKKGLAKLEANFEKKHADGEAPLVVGIGDADAVAEADALADRLRAHYPELRVLRSTIGPTIGCHVGAGMISCCFWGADRRG